MEKPRGQLTVERHAVNPRITTSSLDSHVHLHEHPHIFADHIDTWGPPAPGAFLKRKYHLAYTLSVTFRLSVTSFGTHEVTSVEIRHVIWCIERNVNILEIKGANRFHDRLLVFLMRYKVGA